MRAFWERIKAGVSLVYVVVLAVLSSPGLANAVYQLFVQFWQGFSRVLDPDVVPYLTRAKNSRAVLARSAYTNIVLYAGVVLFYEAGLRNLLRYGMPAMEDSWAEFSLDLLVRTCLEVHFLMDNVMLGAAIQQAGKLDNPDLNNDCEHETTKKIQSRLASMMYYGGNSAALSFIEWRDPAARWPLRSLFYGRYFVEQGAGGRMCTDDRNAILNRNNPYTFGMGLSFLLLLSLACYVVNAGLKKVVRVESNYVDDAIFCLLFQYFLMLAYSNKKPLPGRMPGVDVTLPGRVATRYVVQTAVDTVIPLLGEPKEELDWKSIEAALNHYPKMIVTNQAMVVVQHILFGADWSSRETFLRKPIPLLLFPLFEKTWRAAIQDSIAWCETTRRKGTAVNVVGWFEWMMGIELIPEYKKKVVKLVSISEFVEFLRRFDTYLDWIKLVQGGGIDKEIDRAAEERERAVRFIQSPANLLIGVNVQAIESVPAAPTAADAAVTDPAAADSVRAAIEQMQATPVLAAAAAAAPPSLSLVPVPPVVQARNTNDVPVTLKAIAGLPAWQQQGAGVFGSKVPDGIMKIRAANADIQNLYLAIKSKLDSNDKASRGLPADMTNEFYALIKQCFDRRHDANACYELIAKFADAKLTIDERRSIGLEPQRAPVALRR